MADYAMELRSEHLEQIGTYVRSHLAEWLPPQPAVASAESVQSLHVEIVRVQEEVRANRSILEKHIEFTEKRFEQVDKRFDEVIHSMDKRFEAVQHNMDKRFESMQHNMDKRFEQVDKRFESMQQNMNDRFDDLQRSIRNGQWFIGLLVTFVMAASTAVQVLL